jgi:hypothetical protein
MAATRRNARPAAHDAAEAVVDPRCRLSYYTYVLRALEVSGCTLRYRRLDCPVSKGMAMLVDGTRVWVDTDDFATVPDAIREWADVIAKVNVEPGAEAAAPPSVVPLGPLFGIRLWPLPLGYRKAVGLVAGGANLVKTLQYLRFQGITRRPIEAYEPGESDPTYVFHRSRRWGYQDIVNERRRRFDEAVGTLGLETDVTLAEDRIDLTTYLERTRRSAVVFNSPAIHECLGWKLGEYLALGKAVVSLPLHRALPAPLVHGQHVHYVDDDVAAIRDAVRRIIDDHDYRRHLELGARAWYEANMTPAVVGARLLAAARQAPTRKRQE